MKTGIVPIPSSNQRMLTSHTASKMAEAELNVDSLINRLLEGLQDYFSFADIFM